MAQTLVSLKRLHRYFLLPINPQQQRGVVTRVPVKLEGDFQWLTSEHLEFRRKSSMHTLEAEVRTRLRPFATV